MGARRGRRPYIAGVLVAATCITLPAPAAALTGAEITVMIQSGLPDSVIVGQIQAAGPGLLLAPGEREALQAAGASPAVMAALLPMSAGPAAAPAQVPPAAPRPPAGSLPPTAPVSTPEPAPTSSIEWMVGLKGGANGAGLIVEDKFESAGAKATFKGDDAVGFGGHAGLYAQARLWRAVGLELGLAYSKDQLKRTETFGLADVEHTDWAKTLRIPLLLKGFIVLDKVSFSLGVGPEYVTMLDTGHDVTEGPDSGVTIDERSLEQQADLYTSVAADAWFLNGQLEIAIELDSVVIPFALRAGKNLSQTDQFEDRFDYTLTGSTITHVDVAPTYTWDFRFSTGAALRF